MTRRQFVASARLSLLVGLLCSPGFGQKPEFDFFPEFRNVFTVKVRAENPYEIVQTKADFYELERVDVLRMVAVKP